jgi:Tol biopolymer transport system component
MMLESGTRLGPYEIIAPLGAGGMGEVYRARDTKLERHVALKILPDSFASDPDRLMRFEREAKTLASLNHPNIGAIYGIEHRALVMELVEGEDLSERIARGAVPMDEALPIARQIAEALEAAHEAGVIHRDLKPANIKVRHDGTVKVLDFGLARALDPAGIGAAPSSAPHAGHATMTSPAMTAMGLILGTAAYMAPEQARGRVVDRRADVWAFGAVLYEMLTGRRAFAGAEISDVLAAVLKDAPAFGELPPETPEPIRRLLRRCLEKDPRERLAEMSAARLEIRDALAGGAPDVRAASERNPRGWTRVSLGLALLSAALTVMLVAALVGRPAADPNAPVLRFPLVSDAGLRILTTNTQPFAVSLDGRTIVFTADAGSGVHLWVRTLDAVAPRRLDDTAGGSQPAISPDGEWIAFVVANHLIRKVPVAGGPATTITSIDDVTASLAWTSDDEIVFEMIGSGSGIHRVRASGGQPELLIPLDAAAGETGQRRPLVLLEERAVLYTSGTDTGPTTLAMFSLEDGRRRRLGVEGVQAVGVIEAHLIYSRNDGALMAAPFDASRMEMRGEARQLADRVTRSATGTAVALSPTGTLVFGPPVNRASRLVLGDAAGTAVPVGDRVREFEQPRLSPEGGRIAVGIANGATRELWVIDRASDEATRVTQGGVDVLCDWTADGKALIHLRSGEVWRTSVDGTAGSRKLVTIQGRVADASALPDGESVLAVRINQGSLSGMVRVVVDTGREVSVLADTHSGRRPRPNQVRVSPDGRWVAYTDANEREVYVREVDGTRTLQVSDQGGSRPMWSRDSQRLFYQAPGGLTAAHLQTAPQLAVRSRPLILPPSFAGSVYDVSADGKSFLALETIRQGPAALVAFGWADDVRRQLRK